MITVKVPKVVPIGAHRYQTYFSEWADKHGRAGTVLHVDQWILLAPSPQNSALFVNYMHEVVHIIGRTFGIDMDEREVDGIAEGLTQFLTQGLGIELDWSGIETIGAELPKKSEGV